LLTLLCGFAALEARADPPPHIREEPFVTGTWRVTGTKVPALSVFRSTVETYMKRGGISAGALAVTVEGRLVLAQGYTLDSDTSYAVSPRSRFRIASLSKPLTASVVLALVQERELRLDTRVTALVPFEPPAGQRRDPRLDEITVRHLLRHRGGWSVAELGFDPMFADHRIARALGVELPISQEQIIRYMSGVPLSFDPGTRAAYSNFGYMVLGRVIEAVTGRPYERSVERTVLAPLKMNDTQLGRTLPEYRAPGEVRYESDFRGPSVFTESRDGVPMPYGGWNLENMDAHGGWISSALDMARFLASFHEPGAHPVLSERSVRLMFGTPKRRSVTEEYYGMGWRVRHLDNRGFEAWHAGSLDGSLALMVHRPDGASWVALFNRRDSRVDRIGESYWKIDEMLEEAADAVEAWPTHDAFVSRQ
jgi:CubicO group peptidase (beta-lactamase class C family)